LHASNGVPASGSELNVFNHKVGNSSFRVRDISAAVYWHTGVQFEVVFTDFTDQYTVKTSTEPNAVVVSSDFETAWQANAE
jgi:hypothetical protein